MRRNKYLSFLAIFVCLILLLSGCSAKGMTSNNNTANKPIKIGFLVDKTGALAAYGYAHEQVAKATVQTINQSGGVSGRQLELDIKDTQSNANIAAVQARQLVENDDVDFLMGTNTSAVATAVAPVAKELQTVYFPTTGYFPESGGSVVNSPNTENRWVFDFNTNVHQEALGVASFIKNDLKVNNWATVVVDYDWGWDDEHYFAEAAKEDGINITAAIRVPLGTDNWVPYLLKLPPQTKGVYFANFGTDFLAFNRDLAAVRPDIVRIGANYVISGQDISQLGNSVNGLYVVSGDPTWDTTDQFDLAYRKAIGMKDNVETATGKVLIPSYQWSSWETLYAIRDVVVASGWKSKNDNLKFIQTLENMKFKGSLAYPAGDSYFRPADHLSVKSDFIEKINDSKISVIKDLPADSMAYPATINLPQDQPFTAQ